MWEMTTAVGKALGESLGANVLRNLQVIDVSAETGSPYRSFTMPLPEYLDERVYLSYEPFDRLCDISFSIHSIYDCRSTDIMWIIWIVDLSADYAV